MHRSILQAEPSAADPIVFDKITRKIIGVIVAQRKGDIRHRKVCIQKGFLGLFHAQVIYIRGDTDPHPLFEQMAQLGAGAAADFGQGTYIAGECVMAAEIVRCF